MPVPPSKKANFFIRRWLLLANGIFAVIVLLLILTPYLSSISSKLAGFLYLVFKPTCHQSPTRSYYLFGKQLPVCARCTGIYISMLLSGLIYALFRRRIENPLPLLGFIIIMLPITIDGLAQTINIWDTGNIWRSITGLLCGIAVVFFVYPYIDEQIAKS